MAHRDAGASLYRRFGAVASETHTPTSCRWSLTKTIPTRSTTFVTTLVAMRRCGDAAMAAMAAATTCRIRGIRGPEMQNGAAGGKMINQQAHGSIAQGPSRSRCQRCWLSNPAFPFISLGPFGRVDTFFPFPYEPPRSLSLTRCDRISECESRT